MNSGISTEVCNAGLPQTLESTGGAPEGTRAGLSAALCLILTGAQPGHEGEMKIGNV